MKSFGASVVTTNGFALNHDKSLQIFFFCVKAPGKKRLSKRCWKDSRQTIHMNVKQYFLYTIQPKNQNDIVSFVIKT